MSAEHPPKAPKQAPAEAATTEPSAKPAMNSAPKKVASKKPTANRGRITALIGVLVLLGVLGTAGWFGWQFWQQEQQNLQANAQTLAALEQELAQQRTQWTALARRLDDQQAANQRLNETLSATQENLVNLAQQVNANDGLQTSDVIRLEVEYLLRTARYIGQVTKDTAQAMALLQQADRLLNELNEVAYLPVRAAIAQDMQALRDAPNADIDGLYFALQALEQSAVTWQWWPDRSPAPEQPVNAPEAEDALWYVALGRELRQLVTIRYRGDMTADRLPPEAFQQMHTQFRLLLQQAQVAAIQRNQTLYAASLDQAQAWFATATSQIPEARQVSDQLAQLAAQSVAAVIPDVAQGLTALQALSTTESAEDVAP
ncbi:uroporphyrinogen-III C-methyltransferase [Salinispirillum marinum]|uniref:Uroporphyrinogen-III C-methyltransferase n=2 Tax=Saccharospirillaceae TaxID=255527 RepID=A0ABV8BA56_9GAMM